jgi:hypothetical protein
MLVTVDITTRFHTEAVSGSRVVRLSVFPVGLRAQRICPTPTSDSHVVTGQRAERPIPKSALSGSRQGIRVTDHKLAGYGRTGLTLARACAGAGCFNTRYCFSG